MNRRKRYTPTIRVWQGVVASGGGTLTELRGVRDDPACVWVVVEGERAGLIGRASIGPLGLSAGMTIDDEVIERIGPEVCERLCERSAVRSLAMRNHSRAGLVRSLRRKGFEGGVAERIADKYVELGAIDDARFAEIAVRNEIARRPVGRRLLEAKLRAKGIADSDARPAIDQALEGRDEFADAAALAARAVGSIGRGAGKPLEPAVIRRRVSGRLAQRGFSGDAVRRAVEQAMREHGG